MPEPHPAVSIVTAMRNEAATVEALVTRIRTSLEHAGQSFEIILVDDGSNDGTAEIARRLEAADPRVCVYELTQTFGQSAATACGLFAARGAAVVTLDADLQNPPEEIPTLLAALRASSIASGRRATRYEGCVRRFASRSLHWFACWGTGVWIQDFGGNFKAYDRRVTDATLRVWAPPKHFFTTALQLGFPVTEVTVRHEPRRVGQSRYTLRSALRINFGFVAAHTSVPAIVVSVLGGLALLIGITGTSICWWAYTCDWQVAAFLVLVPAGALLCATGAVGRHLRRVAQTARAPFFVVKAGPRHPHGET